MTQEQTKGEEEWADKEAERIVDDFLRILEPWFQPTKEWDRVCDKANEFLYEDIYRTLTARKAQLVEEALKILTDEIVTAHTSESGKTSRLTSAYMRINKLRE